MMLPFFLFPAPWSNRHKNKKPSLTGAGDGTLSWLEGFKAKSGRRHGWSDNNST
jgi:hypothetical protein